MSGSHGMDTPPTVLATLQAPLDDGEGRIQASTVYTLNGSKKRKRSEVVTSVDGEGLNIYTVRNTRLVTSYPTPPQTYFQAPACSICRKIGESGKVTRHTYAAVTKSPIDAEPLRKSQIIHFEEDYSAKEVTAPVSHTYDLEKQKVFAIEILANASESEGSSEDHNVLAVLDDGSLLCLDETLSKTDWQQSVSSLAQSYTLTRSTLKVKHAALVEATTASKGILKGREDVLARVGMKHDAASVIPTSSYVLVLVSEETGATEEHVESVIDLLSVQRQTPHGLGSSGAPVRHLLRWKLPATKPSRRDESSQVLQYSLDCAAGSLFQLTRDAITTFDLTKIVPRVLSKFASHGSDFQSFLRLSSKQVLATSHSAFMIYDIQYDTIQDTMSTERLSDAVTGSKKRKRLSDSVLRPFKFITYYAETGVAVGLLGTELVALRLGDKVSGRRFARRGQSLLVDALGKGTRSRSDPNLAHFGRKLPSELKTTHRHRALPSPGSTWPDVRRVLEDCAASGEIIKFDDTFTSFLSVDPEEIATNDVNDSGRVLLQNGISSSQHRSHDQDVARQSGDGELVQDARHIEHFRSFPSLAFREQALYILGTVFRWTSLPGQNSGSNAADSPKVTIDFLPPQAYRWLVVNNFFTPEMVSQAMLRSSEDLATLREVEPSDLVSSLVKQDPTTQTLFTLLIEATYVDIAILVQAIKVYVQSHESFPPTQSEHRALPQAISLVNGESSHSNLEENGDVDDLLDRATADIDRAESILDASFELRTIGLKYALIKLHAFPRAKITRMLRSELSPNEIRFLIHILRIELQDGGWVSRYVDAGPASLQSIDVQDQSEDDSTSARGPSDSAVLIVSSLLSCCVDAIGIGGWLSVSSGDLSTVPASDDLDPSELLGLLKDETIAVLEGLHEMSFIRNSISEFLRYADRWSKAEAQPNLAERNKRAKRDGTMTVPVSVPVSHDPDLPLQAEALMRAALPVGLKVERKKVESTKVVSGGEIKAKSKREIGQEISRRVGRYSFEQIRV